MGPLGELGALFNPGMRHEIEERQSKANRREEEGNARDGDLRIDLASGVAVINMSNNGEHPASAPHETPHQEPTPAADDSSEDAADGSSDDSADGSSDDAADGSAGDAAVAADGTTPTSADRGNDAVHPAAIGDKPLTAAQVRRLAAAARRSAGGDQRARVATPRPANAQLPSSKASRAAR